MFSSTHLHTALRSGKPPMCQKNGLRLLATRMSPRGNGGNAQARANQDAALHCKGLGGKGKKEAEGGRADLRRATSPSPWAQRPEL